MSGVRESEHTLHNLCHYQGGSPENVRKYLAWFIPLHQAWIKHIAYSFFTTRGIDPFVYMRELISDDFSYDQLAILTFARMYHIQIKIVISKCLWITSKRQPKEQFDIVLAFFGQNVFTNIKLSTSVEYIPSFPSAVKDEIKEEIETDQDFPVFGSPISTEDLKVKE